MPTAFLFEYGQGLLLGVKLAKEVEWYTNLFHMALDGCFK